MKHPEAEEETTGSWQNYANKSNVKLLEVEVRARTYRMPERTFGIQAITIQPVPAIPGVKPGIFTMPILTFTPLKRERERERGISDTNQTLLLAIYFQSKNFANLFDSYKTNETDI